MTTELVLDVSIKELNISLRAYNCLKNANISTIGKLVQHYETEIMKLSGLGRKSLNEIKDELTSAGLSFKPLSPMPAQERLLARDRAPSGSRL